MKNLIFATIIALTLGACGSSNNEAEKIDASLETSKTAAEVSSTAEETKPNKPELGQVHVNFPIVNNTSAKAGEYVLAPLRSTLDVAFAEKQDDAIMIFYTSTMVEPGEKESKVKELLSEVMVPNSILIPIKSEQKVKTGDIVLTWWQSGSGMTRAIVVEGGSETEPKVRYLDIDIKTDIETLKPNSFHKLSEPLEPGTSVAAKADNGREYLQEFVVKVEGEKVLTSGFASILYVRNKADVVALPITPDVAVGDEAYVPVIGAFRKVIVKAVDASTGTVEVEYDWAGQKSTVKVPFGDVIKELPALPTS